MSYWKIKFRAMIEGMRVALPGLLRGRLSWLAKSRSPVRGRRSFNLGNLYSYRGLSFNCKECRKDDGLGVYARLVFYVNKQEPESAFSESIRV